MWLCTSLNMLLETILLITNTISILRVEYILELYMLIVSIRLGRRGIHVVLGLSRLVGLAYYDHLIDFFQLRFDPALQLSDILDHPTFFLDLRFQLWVRLKRRWLPYT